MKKAEKCGCLVLIWVMVLQLFPVSLCRLAEWLHTRTGTDTWSEPSWLVDLSVFWQCPGGTPADPGPTDSAPFPWWSEHLSAQSQRCSVPLVALHLSSSPWPSWWTAGSLKGRPVRRGPATRHTAGVWLHVPRPALCVSEWTVASHTPGYTPRSGTSLAWAHNPWLRADAASTGGTWSVPSLLEL